MCVHRVGDWGCNPDGSDTVGKPECLSHVRLFGDVPTYPKMNPLRQSVLATPWSDALCDANLKEIAALSK